MHDIYIVRKMLYLCARVPNVTHMRKKRKIIKNNDVYLKGARRTLDKWMGQTIFSLYFSLISTEGYIYKQKESGWWIFYIIYIFSMFFEIIKHLYEFCVFFAENNKII